MNPLTITIVCAQLLCGSAEAPPLQPTPAVGTDKFQHVFASAVTVSFAHAAARTLTGSREALAAGTVAAAAVGLWKELHDRRTGRRFSPSDLLADAVGIGLGVLLMAQTR